MKNPFLFKKFNGYYYVAYYDINDNRKTFTTNTKNKSKAQKILTDYLIGDTVPNTLKPILCSYF